MDNYCVLIEINSFVASGLIKAIYIERFCRSAKKQLVRFSFPLCLRQREISTVASFTANACLAGRRLASGIDAGLILVDWSVMMVRRIVVYGLDGRRLNDDGLYYDGLLYGCSTGCSTSTLNGYQLGPWKEEGSSS